MADITKAITIEDLPEPISREDALLHNIIDGTPNIEDLEPLSREEVYLKYIALNGGGSGGGGGSDVDIVQTTGQSQTSVMSQKAVTDEINKLGTAAYCNTGTEEGNVPVINSEGKLDNSVIPSLAITDTFVAEDEEEMLNLQGAEKGDICIRTDENKTYILDETPSRYRRGATRTSLSDWIELQTPTDEVSSVNGQKGNVTITAEDIDTYTKTEIDEKLPNIVQTTGTSTASVMSQKAVSDSLATKVDSVDGKGLSTEDFTTEEKEKLSNLPDTISQINVVQKTGKSKTDVMSQYAVTSMNVIGLNATSNDAQDEILLIGDYSSTNSLLTTTVGYKASTPFAKGTAFGYNSISGVQGTSIGYNSKINEEAINAVSLGNDSLADEPKTVSVGNSELKRRIVNVADPVNNQDAVTKKFLDDTLSGKKVEFLITVYNTWEYEVDGIGFPYYKQTINVSGIQATDEVFVSLSLSSYTENHQNEIHAYRYLSRLTVFDNSILLWSYFGAPNTKFRIKLICLR